MNSVFTELIHKWKKRVLYWKYEHLWNNQFPPISCHPPYASPEELEELEQILGRRREKKKC